MSLSDALAAYLKKPLPALLYPQAFPGIKPSSASSGPVTPFVLSDTTASSSAVTAYLNTSTTFASVMAPAVLTTNIAAALATISVSYDPGYDNGNRALTSVSCSDGTNGLITKYKWNTQGQISNFPYIGGFVGIAGWNSPQCGSCYSITWNGKTINILAIDHTETGFNIAEQAMNDLTGGNAVQLGRIDAQYVQVDISNCKV